MLVKLLDTWFFRTALCISCSLQTFALDVFLLTSIQVWTTFKSSDLGSISSTAFTLVGPKSVKIQSSSQYLFTLLTLRSTGAKAAHRTMMKLTPDSTFFSPDWFLDSSFQESLDAVAEIVFNQDVSSDSNHFLQHFKFIVSQSYMHGSVTV